MSAKNIPAAYMLVNPLPVAVGVSYGESLPPCEAQAWTMSLNCEGVTDETAAVLLQINVYEVYFL